eukprot:gene10998-12161_t
MGLGSICIVIITQLLFVQPRPFSLKGLSENHNDINSLEDYFSRRKELLFNDTKQRTGQTLVLSKSEQKANAILMSWKKKELDVAFKSAYFLSAESFITAKSKIDKSNVFKIIKKMPKGAALHLHDLSMASYKWLIKNVTTLDICYMCYNTDKKVVEFKLAQTMPKPAGNCKWVSVPLARKNSGNPAKFDAELFSNLSMTDGDPKTLYPTQNALWKKFSSIFMSLSGLLGFDAAFSSYYSQGLKELLDDNIQYAEIRALLMPLYDITGKVNNDPENTLKVYKTATEEFVRAHPGDYFNTKIIYIVLRTANISVVSKAVTKAVSLHKNYPSIVSGFDLVGQEDPGNTLLYYAKELLAPSNAGLDLPYFFHAGETNWEGRGVDGNLVDALLLGTKRVGHGFAFVKHPDLMKQAKQKGIPAEVCPISNQVLGLVSDLRNHPASEFLSQDFPMTVNSDDPAIWDATGLSYDFYQVFMAMTRTGGDLRVLKQLAINSIKYSSLEPDQKKQLYSLWAKKWDTFVQNIVNEFPFADN